MNLYLAFDGGGTGTRAGLYDAERNLLAEATGPASSPAIIGAEASVAVLVSLGHRLLDQYEGVLTSIAGAISGTSASHSAGFLAGALCDELGAPRTLISNDLRPLLFANAGTGAAVLAIAGTGSSVVAQDAHARSRTVGGHGVPFGDDGSAFQIGASALRAAGQAVDHLGPATDLVGGLAEAVGVAELDGLVTWAQSATKFDIAALARTVNDLADSGDTVAAACVERQAQLLAEQTLAGADALHVQDDVPVFLNGGLFESCARYRKAYDAFMTNTRLSATPQLAPLRGHRAALEMVLAEEIPDDLVASFGRPGAHEVLPPTERCREDAPPLDTLTALEIVEVMNREDAGIAPAVARESDMIATVVDAVAQAFTAGGRLLYIGAGTSGRLGVLDASECPPTFGIDPARVMGLIAGGEKALRASVEGGEDDREQAKRDLAAIEPTLSENDVVVGIAASGTTPYVHAGLDYAEGLGAKTALVCCNPTCERDGCTIIAVNTGPEALPGSTRLKAGTATKLVLNMITTGAMARAGYIFEGHMVGMRPINAKLYLRATRIIALLTGLAEDRAAPLLHEAGDSIPTAVLMALHGLSADEAKDRLDNAGGNLREAVEHGKL